MRLACALFLAVVSVAADAARSSWDDVDYVRLVNADRVASEAPLFVLDVIDAAREIGDATACFSFYAKPVGREVGPDGEPTDYPEQVAIRWFPTLETLRATEMHGGEPGALLGGYCGS